MALLGRVPGRVPAQVTGWRLASLPRRVYPGLVPGEETAGGYLLRDLRADEWKVIDAFEDTGYDLRLLTLDDGYPAWAYIWTGPASSEDWDPDTFERAELDQYIRRCGAWLRAAQAGQG